MLQLIVTSSFENFAIGDTVTDPGLIFDILNGPNRDNVVEVNIAAQNSTETITLRVAQALPFLPLALAGEIDGAAPHALDYSADGGVTWAAVGSFLLQGDSWSGTGPTYGTAQNGHILVRDHATPSVVSATEYFIVAAAGGGASSGTLALGDGSIIDSIGNGLKVPQLAGASAGPLSVMFGTAAGTVADGGALAAETAARTAADAAAASAATTAQTAATAAEAAATAAQTASVAAQTTAQAAQTAAAAAQTTANTVQTTAAAAGTAAAAAQTAATGAQTTAAGAQTAATGAQATAAAAQTAAAGAQTTANGAQTAATGAQATAAAAQTAAAGAQTTANGAQTAATGAQSTAAAAGTAAAAAQSTANAAQAAAAGAQTTATGAQTTATAAGTAATAAQSTANGAQTAAAAAQTAAAAAQTATAAAQATATAAQTAAAAAQTQANTAQTTATGAQAAAQAALPAAQRGAANGVAPLDTHAMLPTANLPAVSGLGWADQAGTTAVFHRGPVPTPSATRSGVVLADRSKLSGEYNFAEVWDTQVTQDAWPALQNFLLYCQSMALAMKLNGIDNITERNCVRAILPRGAYLISQPLIVPEFVDLDCRGTLYRAAYTGNQSNDGVTSIPGIFATNSFLPTVVVTPRAHAANLNIYVNTDGNIAHRGSGVCIGKTWAAQAGAACTLGNAGTGYAVGDVLFMAQPSVGPYFNWAAQVTAVGGGGATGPIASATVFAAGAYALPPTTYNGGPSLQAQQWTAALGYAVFDPANAGCFIVHAAYKSDQKTASTGTGATLAPTWQADYVAGTAAYNIGSAITNGSQIGKIQVTGGIPVQIDAVHGPTFGVMVTGLETVIGEIQLLGGNAGVYGYFAQDVRIGIINVVEAGVGVELFGCGSWHCPLVVLDTCGAAFLINETQGVRMGFRAFFEQNNIGLVNAYPNSLGNAIQIGSASSAAFPNADIHLDGTLVNMGGLPKSTIAAYPGTAVGGQTARPMAASISLAWLFSSVIRVKATNIGEQGGTPTILPTAGFCVLGQGVDAGNLIEGMIDTVPTIDGTLPPAQLVTLTSGHAFPNCALRVWDGLHQCTIGPFGVVDMFGAAAPVNGASGTGAGLAMPGSSYIDTASGAGRRYVNTGTLAAPAWS